jgi:hypothetical protein
VDPCFDQGLDQKSFRQGCLTGHGGADTQKLGISPQRPLYRSWKQDPHRVEKWKREEYPAIKARAAEVGATILFADEASVRTDYHAGTTWAPVGQTPVVTR